MPTRRTIKARRERLVNALRSGKYKQAQGKLVRQNDNEEMTYCCLGVACKVAGMDEFAPGEHLSFDCHDTELPEKVMSYFGFVTEDGDFFNGHGSPDSLVEWNDKKRKSFKQIATLIESNPRGLFKDLKEYRR